MSPPAIARQFAMRDGIGISPRLDNSTSVPSDLRPRERPFSEAATRFEKRVGSAGAVPVVEASPKSKPTSAEPAFPEPSAAPSPAPEQAPVPLPVVAAPAAAAAAVPAATASYEEGLRALEDMGFFDREVNLMLLKRYGGVVERAVADLINRQDRPWVALG